MESEKHDLEDERCLRCGLCCHYYNKKGKLIKCRFLRPFEDGMTRCAIYGKHVNRVLQRNPLVMCGYRSQSKYNFRGCPYNGDEVNKDKHEFSNTKVTW